jgi:protein PhnA
MENVYPDGDHYVCADCGHEWPMHEAATPDEVPDALVRDAYGNILSDGNAVTLIKDLKVKKISPAGEFQCQAAASTISS